MGVQNFIGQLPYLVAPWFLWIMSYKGFFNDQIEGAAGLAIIIAIIVVGIGVIPAIFLRERFKDVDREDKENTSPDRVISSFKMIILDFFKGFSVTIKSGPFLKLCIATFLVFNGFMLISSFQYYVIIYYVFSGDQTLGAEYAGYAGTLGSISTFIVIVFITWLATKIGKRRAFFVSTGISMIGYALKWICYNPDIPLMVVIPAPIMAFGLGGLFVLMPSMIADVVDFDELETHQRREGMYGSIFWWMVKLGLSGALVGGGLLLEATGFDVALNGEQSTTTILLIRLFDAAIPFIASAIAIWSIALFPITEEKAHEVRLKLEKRRGKPESVAK
jgi:GPH family glycoside/pentoside/hexuronide:cation symporter